MTHSRFAPAARAVLRVLGFAAIIVAAASSCRDRTLTGPGLPLAGPTLALVPRFQQAPAGGPTITLSSIRAVLHLADGDSIVTIANFDGDSAVIQFDVDVLGSSQVFHVDMAATDATGDTVFRAADTVRAYPVGSPNAPRPGSGTPITL